MVVTVVTGGNTPNMYFIAGSDMKSPEAFHNGNSAAPDSHKNRSLCSRVRAFSEVTYASRRHV
ncbi:hypothetical protein AB8R75_25285 [Klebsiella quasipneumoniae subsp. similipneumoniae]|uniref:hypothetical protein n=1 Tax=Klebsiella quasipneumoniae TaxID=1463165 RepID=UPI0038D03061